MNFRNVVVTLAALIGVAHIGILGHLLQVINEDKRVVMPSINLPTGPYSSYDVNVSKEGYALRYKANDPKILRSRDNIDLKKVDQYKGGFLSPARNHIEDHEQYTEHEYTMDGFRNIGGGSSNIGGKSGVLTAEQRECIKAEGSGESTGAMIGAGLASSVAPVLSGIPYVGWLASGWAVMLGQKKGSELGSTVATTLKDCNA